MPSVLAVFLAVLAIDQGAKTTVVRTRVRHLRNARPGVALIANHMSLFGVWLLIACALPLLLAATGSLESAGARFGLAAVLGGTLSNLLDLYVRGAVVDFIDLRVWPVFNLADSAIVLGTSAILASVLR